jgi:hypothetical protein
MLTAEVDKEVEMMVVAEGTWLTQKPFRTRTSDSYNCPLTYECFSLDWAPR